MFFFDGRSTAIMVFWDRFTDDFLSLEKKTTIRSKFDKRPDQNFKLRLTSRAVA